MSTILDTIIKAKRNEIERYKPLSSIERFRKEGFFWDIPNRSLKQSLLLPDSTGIIAEFKRKSPSKGWFKDKEVEVEPVVVPYNNKGAAGISVLTDTEFFGGDMDDLIQTKIITDVPILRKDFIIDEWQIAESKAFGADVILLIAACLSVEEVKRLALFAKTIGLEVLLEIHNEEELGHICAEVDMVGVNNRNLKTFEVNIDISLELITKIPSEKPAVAESGISNVETIVTLRNAGFRGFLIGETFMKEPDPAIAFAGFVEKLKAKSGMRIKVCGMTLPEQVNALDEMGVDFAGFIFYPKSPRYMANKISPEKMRQINRRIAKVGVFVNTAYDELLKTVESYRLDMVQLHGDETPFFAEKIANYVTVIKAFRLSDNDPIDWITRPFHDNSDMYMFDTMGAGYGGTGKKFDWNVLKTANIDKLFFLSGGIESGDEQKLKDFANEEAGKKLFAVDINSRFEVGAGVKNMEKIKIFIENLKNDSKG